MLICIFAGGPMREIQGAELGIGEDEVTKSSPMVRALLVQRLEQIWSVVQPHVTGDVKADPRFIEAGIRVLDRLAKLYRLDQPLTQVPETGVDERQVALDAVKQQISDLELRMSPMGE